MSICIGATAAGARWVTATASAGLAYMWEMLYIAASMRMPIVMTVANRALSGPINIHCDHSDAMGARDSGWVQIFGENVQEAYDNSLMSFRIAEHMDVRLPVMNCLDGFIVTRAIESLTPLEDEAARKFVGEFRPTHPLLDYKNPLLRAVRYARVLLRAQVPAGDGHEQRPAGDQGRVRRVREAHRAEVRQFIETYRTEDADYVAISMGSTAGTMKQVVDDLRKEEHKVGCIKIRVFRPFPYAEMAKALEGKKAVAVMDRAISFGAMGPLFADVRSAEFDNRNHPRTVSYIYGLGGRDVGVEDLKVVFRELESGSAKIINYLGVKQ